MTYAQIVSAVKKLKKKYGTSDPYELCNCLNIKVIQGHHGTGEGSLKGFFMEHCRIRIITVNADLPKIFQRIIIAHELGHAVMHRAEGVRTFQDVTLFDSSSTCEKEANLFAAELMLEDDDVFEKLNADCTFFTAAEALFVPMELLDFKFRMMKWKGYMLMEAPISARSNFLRDVEVPRNDDDHIC